MSDTLLKLTGDIENIVFKNKSNGYKVVELFSDSSLVICTGIMPDVNVGDTITFSDTLLIILVMVNSSVWKLMKNPYLKLSKEY